MENRFKELLMKAIDEELSVEEQKIVEDLSKTNEEFAIELEKLKMLKSETNKLKLKEPVQEKWDEYWLNVYYRFERNVGWFFLSLGAIIIGGYALFQFVNELIQSDSPMLIKLGIGGISIGLAVLFVSVVRERLILRKSDKYKDIIR